MRTRMMLSLAVLGCVVWMPGYAQSTPATASPQTEAPVPAGGVPSLPAYDPAEKHSRHVPVAPAAAQVPAVATPKPAPQPTVTTAPATPQQPYTAYPQYGPGDMPPPDHLGSAYIPVDNWVYPAMTRLYSLGYVDTMFLGMRPWTRRSVLHMLQESQDAILRDDNAEAQEILAVVLKELETEVPSGDVPRGTVYGLFSGYTRLMGVGGTTLRDSYHVGQTLVNDYGRPYQSGFNSLVGFSTLNEMGRFSLHVRGEYQHAPAGEGYTLAQASQLSLVDGITYAPPNAPQTTIPEGSIAAQNPFRLVEATLSFHVLGHEISGGKSDAWLGPAAGGSMAWSNNAENIYSFRINRVEPLRIPLVSRVLGPMRYDFFYGSLKGHSYPNHPWVHAEGFSFQPTHNLTFGFERTLIFGGAGHEPVTLHTFLNGFFSINDTTQAEKYSRNDPGARFSNFNLSYRLPFVRNYLTFYMDSTTHDDVTPISAPRRSPFRTGLYLSQFPRLPKLDMRVEAVSTDCSTHICSNGSANYIETIQRQGYTNKGIIFGDWIGREAKGGQAWLTYHLSGKEWVELAYLTKKTPWDFIAGGTTQNQFKVSVVKRLGPDIELNGWLQYERWKAPLYKPGLQSDTVGAFQVTWYPQLHTSPAQR